MITIVKNIIHISFGDAVFVYHRIKFIPKNRRTKAQQTLIDMIYNLKQLQKQLKPFQIPDSFSIPKDFDIYKYITPQ